MKDVVVNNDSASDYELNHQLSCLYRFVVVFEECPSYQKIVFSNQSRKRQHLKSIPPPYLIARVPP